MPAAKPRAYFVCRRAMRQRPACGGALHGCALHAAAPCGLHPARGSGGTPKKRKQKVIVFIVFLAAVSLAAFILYGVDKSRAKRGAWRISEKALLCLSFFGGAAGGLLGMALFRHKTRHRYFWAVNFLGLAWQAAAIVLLALYA